MAKRVSPKGTSFLHPLLCCVLLWRSREPPSHSCLDVNQTSTALSLLRLALVSCPCSGRWSCPAPTLDPSPLCPHFQNHTWTTFCFDSIILRLSEECLSDISTFPDPFPSIFPKLKSTQWPLILLKSKSKHLVFNNTHWAWQGEIYTGGRGQDLPPSTLG